MQRRIGDEEGRTHKYGRIVIPGISRIPGKNLYSWDIAPCGNILLMQ